MSRYSAQPSAADLLWKTKTLALDDRIVITGIGLASPNGNSLAEFRQNLLDGKSGVVDYETRYMPPVLAGVCNFDELRYQKRKEVRRGTRAGSIAVYCSNEAIADSGLNWDTVAKDRVGVYLGITEHGNVETENEIYEISQFAYDTKVWSHHHNPRTVANNPAGEVTLSLGITGPHLTIGAACAAGNAGFIQAAQMLRLGECDVAIAGGVSGKAFIRSASSPAFRARARWLLMRTRHGPVVRLTHSEMGLSSRKVAVSVRSNGLRTRSRVALRFMGKSLVTP